MSTVTLLNKNVIGNSLIDYVQWVSLVDHITNTGTIGQILYTFYLAYFLIAGIILLIALIGAVTLTYQINTKEILDTSTFKQISRLKNNAIFNLG
jgi:NADH:ubiquinone oxidoreductase subunit 6 (subunit J)